jgi:hypothetical protein
MRLQRLMTGHNWGLLERERGQGNNFITTHTVLLRGKRECGESGGTDVGISSKEKVEAAIADPKLDITEPKGVDSLGGNRVFTRAKEIVEESDAAHVGKNGEVTGRSRGSMCDSHDATEDLDWNSFDAIRGRVFLPVGGEHDALDAKIDIAIGG